MNHKNTKKILRFLILFFLIISPIYILNSIYVSQIYSEKISYRNENQYFQIDKEKLEIISYGDSHPAFAFNPEYVSNSFNYALGSETLEQSYFKFRKSASENPNLKIVLFPLDLQTFENYRINPFEDIIFWSRYMTYGEIEKKTNLSSFGLFVKRNYPIIGNGAHLKRIFSEDQTTFMYKGWQRKENNEFKSSKYLGELRTPIIDEIFLESLVDIMELSIIENVTVVFVKYPMAYQFLQKYDPKEVEKFYIRIEDEINEYSNYVILDYQEKYSDNESLFYNEDHVNYIGAEIFSKEINKDLRKIINR